MKKHVLVAGKIHPDGLDLLRSSDNIVLDYVEEVSTQSMLPHIGTAHALLLRTQPLPADMIALATELEFVSRHGVGYDAVDMEALNARNIPLAVVGDVNSRSVAEHSFALMLAAARRLLLADRQLRQGNWNYRNSLDSVELEGKTLLVVGFGRIGRRVAEIAAVFGMKIQAFDPWLAAGRIRQYGAIALETLEEGLKRADVVTLHIPACAGKTLIGEKEIALMKKGAILVNTARGTLIDEKALNAAVEEGRIAAAGLDVFHDEPPLADNPLLHNPRIVLTPHSAGLNRETAQRMALSAAQNIVDFFAGRLDPGLIVNKQHLHAG